MNESDDNRKNIQKRIRGVNKIHKYTKKKTYSDKKRLRKNDRPVFKKGSNFLWD